MLIITFLKYMYVYIIVEKYPWKKPMIVNDQNLFENFNSKTINSTNWTF